MNKIKETFLAIALAAYSTFGCQYNQVDYHDYIAGVNAYEQHSEAIISKDQSGKASIQFNVVNNMTVDFPVTVVAKLTSTTPIFINDSDPDNRKPEILRCKLQYRVLPDGNWVTVKEYNVPTGTIPMESVPATYFGKNNVWPKDCKAGDVVMIRLYVTDGNYQSGDLQDMCEDQLGVGKSLLFPQKYTLPDNFSYFPKGNDLIACDLGGRWLPHYVVTVVYSGKTRPLQ